MTKFAKLSLIAALALAGTAASAQELTEAIKNVDISGTAVYRYNDYGKGSTTQGSSNNYKVAVSLKSKVTDDVSFNSRVLAGDDGSSKDGKTDGISMPTSGEDKTLALKISEVSFTYSGLENTSITLGKQGINTAFSYGASSTGAEQVGTGIVAQTTFAPLTVHGAYFNQTNLNKTAGLLTGGESVAVVGLAASFAGFNADASYIKIDDVFNAYTFGLATDYTVDGLTLSPFARYSSLKKEKTVANKNNSLWKVGLGAKMGIFGANAIYGKTGKDGGTVSLRSDADAGLDQHWMVTLSGNKNSSAFYADANAQITDKVNVSINYSSLNKPKTEKDENELYGQVTYDHSKNLSTYVKYGTYKVDGKSASSVGRLNIQYSF